MAMGYELQKDSTWAPLTPEKPLPGRLGFDWDRKWDVNKSVSNFEGEGSGKDFVDTVMAGKFSKKDSSNSEELVGPKSGTVLRKVSFTEFLLAPCKLDQQKTSEVKTTSPCLSTPMKAEDNVNLSIPRNYINVQSTPPPTDCQHSFPRSSFEIPPTPLSTNIQASSQAIEKNSFKISPILPAINETQASLGPVQENGFVFPPQTQAARQDIPTNIFQTPSTDQNDQGVYKKPPRQPKQRRRMKKHRPKVVVDGHLKKPPKTPKVPKTPKTPKMRKATKTPKRKSCKRVLDFNSNEPDKVKDGEDDRVVLEPKDDLQEELKNSSKGSENAENRAQKDQVKDDDDRVVRMVENDLQEEVKNGSKGSANAEDEFEQDQVKDEEDDRVVLVPYDLQEEVKNGSKESEIAEHGVQFAYIPDLESNLNDFITKRVTSKRSTQMRKRTCMKVINQNGCSQKSLKVYVRKFQPNQCLKNSRKLGPNFPRICKKPRTRRQKTTSVEILLSIIPPKIGDGQVKKVQRRHKKSFKCVFSWGARRKRSKALTRRRILSSPTVKITPDQSLPFLPGPDHGNVILPSPTAVNPILDPLSPYPGQDTSNVNLPCPTDLALNPEIDQLPLPELGVVTPTHMNPNCEKSSPLVQDVGTSSLRVDSEQIIPLSLQELGIVRRGVHNSLSKSGNKRSKIVTPRQKLSPPVKASMDDIEDCAPSSSDFARKLINVIEGLEALHIGNECNKQLVIQDQNASTALVKIDAPKKPKKISAKVDLDEESLRVWNLLMENNGTDPFEEMEEDKEQWWKDQREIFHGRIYSFIARLHWIQGDRRFSPWKGSVVDSIVGVYLTQNVSDHLSSSAFMTLAAKFPAKTTSETGQTGVIVCCQEPVGSNKEADEQLPDGKENQLEMGNENANIIKDETPATKSGPISDAILGETLKGSFCDGKPDPVSDAVPGEISKGSFLDGNAATNEPCLRGPQHLNSVDNLQKISSVTLDLNLPLWDPFGILQGKSVADRKKKRKHDGDINDPNASLSRNEVKTAGRGRNGVDGGKKAETTPRKKKTKAEEKPEIKTDWDELRKKYCSCRGRESGRNINSMDSVDWEAVRCSTVDEISKTIKDRGMNNILARRIKEFLDRIYKDHGSLDLEWLRDVPPDKAKEYLLSIDGLGLKSVECIRLLCLHHVAFPVDTNVARVAVRLGWVPLQPLAEEVMLHNLNAYPLMDSVQKYLWPRLLNLPQKDLYELHYQMITFGKVFCTMRNPNCAACPMKEQCRHFASAVASRGGRFLTRPEEKRMTVSNVPVAASQNPSAVPTSATNPSFQEFNFNISDSSNFREDHSCQPINGPNVPVADQNPSVVVTPEETNFIQEICISDSGIYTDDRIYEPIIEAPPSPGPIDIETQVASDLEDVSVYSDDNEIPTLRIDTDELRENLRDIIVSRNPLLQGEDLTRALVALTEEAASYPVRHFKHVERLRTIHQVYELPVSHPLLDEFERRDPDDIMPYILAIWTSGEAVGPERGSETSCSSASTSIQEFNQETVWGTILIPCRTATRGAFPLNGTYFQVNELFADYETSQEPIRIPKEWLRNLRKRDIFCGASASAILRGLTILDIQHCFWEGFICVRGFDRRTRLPQRLDQRFHINTIDAALEKKRDHETMKKA